MTRRRSESLKIDIGEDYDHVVTFGSAVDVPMDVSGWSDIRSQIRERAGAPALLATFDVDDSNAADGIIVFSLTDDDTADLTAGVVAFDVERVSNGRKGTVLKGRVIVNRTVTE